MNRVLIGGIVTAADALEFMLAGASAVQVGTANFVHPGATMDIIDGLKAFMHEHGVKRIDDIIGTLRDA